MGYAAPDKPVSFGPPVTRIKRIHAELRRLDAVLAELLDEPERLRAPWFEDSNGVIGRPRPEYWVRR